GGTHFTHVTRILFAADFTRDGTVDADDLARWQSDFGTYSPHSDANNNGVTDGQDFLIWQRKFGSGPTPTMHAIPEPPSILLLCLGQILAGRLGVGRKSAHDRSWSAFLANNVDKI